MSFCPPNIRGLERIEPLGSVITRVFEHIEGEYGTPDAVTRAGMLAIGVGVGMDVASRFDVSPPPMLELLELAGLPTAAGLCRYAVRLFTPATWLETSTNWARCSLSRSIAERQFVSVPLSWVF